MRGSGRRGHLLIRRSLSPVVHEGLRRFKGAAEVDGRRGDLEGGMRGTDGGGGGDGKMGRDRPRKRGSRGRERVGRRWSAKVRWSGGVVDVEVGWSGGRPLWRRS